MTKIIKKPRAQIVATIGPATAKPEILRKAIESGMNIARLNFSWGTHEEHAHRIASIRSIAEEFHTHIPIIQDLSGPRVQEKAGHAFDVSADEILTPKDLNDLDFGAAQNVEYIAMSFVGDARDIKRLRHEMDTRGMTGKTRIIAKIERAKAVSNLDAIIAEADAIMVARGDLGNEIPLEAIPFVQLDIIKKAKKASKPVITATQMMLTMTTNLVPTRAEVSDVAYAIIEGSDAVMLSEESAQGSHPVEAIAMMERIIIEAENHEFKPIVNNL